MKTVFVADKNGQLGNQLFLFAHFISNAIENNYRLYFPAFNELSVYFEHASKNNYGNYPIKSRVSRFNFINDCFLFLIRYFVAVLYRIFPVSKWHRVIRLYHTYDMVKDQNEYYIMENEKDFLSNEKLLILQGWRFRSPKCVIKHSEIVRPFFELKPIWKKKISDLINKCRKDCDVLIGVHIRRGDYKTFLNGIYYFDDESYRNYMLQVSKLFPDKKIRFLICSNEIVSILEPEGCSITYPKGHFIEDLYSLAECDYIIGPPSTFSQWASYYGNKPLKILSKPNGPILSLEEFKVAAL